MTQMIDILPTAKYSHEKSAAYREEEDDKQLEFIVSKINQAVKEGRYECILTRITERNDKYLRDKGYAVYVHTDEVAANDYVKIQW